MRVEEGLSSAPATSASQIERFPFFFFLTGCLNIKTHSCAEYTSPGDPVQGDLVPHCRGGSCSPPCAECLPGAGKRQRLMLQRQSETGW